jgi:Xaa-Pro aminopeptidase
MIEARLSALRQALAAEKLDAIFSVDRANIRYLSGYTGDEAYLLIGKDKQFLITDFRYQEQAETECPEYQVTLHHHPAPPLPQVIKNLCAGQGIGRLGFERDHITYAMYDELNQAVADTAQLVPISGLAEGLRYVKSDFEVSMMRMACAATDQVLADICGYIKPGVTEKDVAREMLYFIMKQGCDASFPSIVASGTNGSLPHAIPTDRQIKEHEFITMDFGCTYAGYHADMTRTVIIGKPDAKQKEIYAIVLEAKQRAEAVLRAGLTGQQVDAVARDFIAGKGYGANFGHGLGHGVGLDIHEQPRLNQSSEQVLQSGCLVTVEPGIYLPGWGGVRVEDTVLVTEAGHENLFYSQRELICL